MPLGWIDFSKSERNKVMNVMHLLNTEEQGVVDELGIGAIRDAFADKFFPGTSTVQTRAKYFLIVPFVLMEAGTGRYGSEPNAILQRINDEERRCRDIMISHSTDGVIGGTIPESWVIRAPSSIYWNGIRKFGIFKADLSIREYVRQSILQRTMKQAKLSGNRNDNAEENEKDDFDAGDITSFHFWNLGDIYRMNWRETLSIDLSPQEAAFLKTQILSNQRSSLLSFVLSKKIDLDRYESFGAFAEDIRDSVDSETRNMMELANQFNSFVALITTRYNMIVSNGKNQRACERWEFFSTDLQYRSKVNLKTIFNLLNINRSKLKSFLLQTQQAFQMNDIDMVDRLIIQRESSLKTPKRAKTLRAGEFNPQSWIGLYMFDYRFSPAQRIIRDIMHPKEVPHV